MESLAFLVSIIFLSIIFLGIIAGFLIPFLLVKLQKWLRLLIVTGCVLPFWFIPNFWFIMPFSLGFLPTAIIYVFFQKQ